ncbi:uncharacterized protein LOC110458432 [Mizuhopecten yessoensis]|uniref:uncharacterized protein LOC110458432 n=1 Tax=Mizuhopecten yessoensis TaxID=6573 RepID=UPI000B458BCF|nr:uncharacterized protein LOC110458432 [Mizuhopecten yessoensis]
MWTVLFVSIMALLVVSDQDMTTNFQKYCETNAECGHPLLCCSITPAFGKRHLGVPNKRQNLDKDFNVHYCLPYKDINATWCTIGTDYSVDSVNFHGLCPCRPGLVCAPTTDLDPHWYPRDRYGKCVPASL